MKVTSSEVSPSTRVRLPSGSLKRRIRKRTTVIERAVWTITPRIPSSSAISGGTAGCGAADHWLVPKKEIAVLPRRGRGKPRPYEPARPDS